MRFSNFKDFVEVTEKTVNVKQPDNVEDGNQPFGWLLAIDLYEAKGPLMQNNQESAKAIKKFLIDLVKELKMDVGGEPVCLMSDKEDIKKYPTHVGASAWICLITSGIQLHTIVPKEFACIDVFSCKNFDPRMTDDFLKESFQTEKIMSAFIKRGINYNKKNFKHSRV